MPNGVIPTKTTVPTGGLNYEDYKKKLDVAASQTREVQTPTSSPSDLISGMGGDLKGTYKAQAEAGVEAFAQEAAVTQKEAEKAATAQEMMGGVTTQYMQNLEAIQARTRAQMESSEDAFGAAAEKADEYVQAARGRVSTVLNKLDEINTQIMEDRDFAKAHAMQASVQATLGSMKAEERNIIENYGMDSKEYQQFVGSKQTALATVQSNIHASYQRLADEQGKTYMNVTADAMTKSHMYLGFQEQQHVEMLKYREQSKQAYALQAAQFDVGVEQLKMAGMENLANWIIETPTFSMDMTPLVTMIGDLVQTQKAAEQAYDLANPATRVPSLGSAYSPQARRELGSRASQEKRAREKALY